MAYLDGYPDLEGNNLRFGVTIFFGVRSGAQEAGKGVRKLSKIFAGQPAGDIPDETLIKTAIYPIVKQTAKALGLRTTKQIFARTISKIVPVIGGLTSGGLTYVMFTREAAKLKKELRDDMHIEIEVGYGLASTVKDRDGLLAKAMAARAKLAADHGITVPPVRVKDNVLLSENEYRIVYHSAVLNEGKAAGATAADRADAIAAHLAKAIKKRFPKEAVK
jgi:hypothetical protein